MVENHAFLVHKNRGMSRYLRGKVLVELVFVSDRQSFWTHSEKDDFYSTHKSALNEIQRQAKAAGTSLSFTTLQGEVTYNGTLDPKDFSEFYSTIRTQFLRQRKFELYKDYISTRKQSYEVDEVAVVFVLEQRFRAFAQPSQEFEYCAVTSDSNAHVICHELLHLFGAVDLYYPCHIYGLTMKYFPKSIMCTWEGMEVDQLNQYLIGWKTELSPTAKAFVNKVSDYTEERYYAALDLEYHRNREDELLNDAVPFESLRHIYQISQSECNPWAEFLLGLCYRDGLGVEKDLKKAEEYFSRSSRTGLVIAAVAHAQMMIFRGISTQQDSETLKFLLEYNSSDHIKLASLRLACRFKGIGLEKDPALAAYHAQYFYKEWKQYLPYYKRSARLYRIAERYSAKLPELHREVEKMRTQYEQMLETGDPDVAFLVARETEKKAKNNTQRHDAILLYDQAARGNNYRACQELGRCYREGMGTPKNLEYARQWSAYADYCREQNPWDAFCHLV